jgi:delta-aminolevulinic acid dehydratase/porphobilinogen synthase
VQASVDIIAPSGIIQTLRAAFDGAGFENLAISIKFALDYLVILPNHAQVLAFRTK